jgi:hypothetical protein
LQASSINCERERERERDCVVLAECRVQRSEWEGRWENSEDESGRWAFLRLKFAPHEDEVVYRSWRALMI